MVEYWTPDEGSGVRNLPPPCCVLEKDTLLPESTGNTRKQWLCQDITEKLLTGTLNLNTNIVGFTYKPNRGADVIFVKPHNVYSPHL